MQPSLEYQHAFDLCAVEAHRMGGPVAVFASSPFYARELLKRLQDCETALAAIGEWSQGAADLQRWLGEEVDPATFSLSPPHPSHAHCAIWAEPEWNNREQVLKQIARMLHAEGHLYVIASGWLARFLPEWQRNGNRPGQRPVGLRRTIGWLQEGGFTIRGWHGFHGPQSILWGYASRWMEQLGRGDLADRCLFRMRATYVVQGWQAFLVPVSLAWAQRRVGIL
jgi:hypothetical protein